MYRSAINNIKKLLFNVINNNCPSSILRGKILKLFGAIVEGNTKVEKIQFMHYEGDNMHNLIISKNVFIGPGTILDIKDKIIIGESVKIGPGCTLLTHEDCGKENIIVNKYPIKHEKTVIGKGSWIGARSTILCGTIVGENVVIGACALVTKNIPNNSIAYGVPAKIKGAI